MSDEYTPTIDEVRAAYFVRKTGLVVSAMSHYPEFDRMIAEVERAAAEKAWDEGARWAAVECGAIATEDAAWIAPGENPYRAEAYRQEMGEQ